MTSAEQHILTDDCFSPESLAMVWELHELGFVFEVWRVYTSEGSNVRHEVQITPERAAWPNFGGNDAIYSSIMGETYTHSHWRVSIRLIEWTPSYNGPHYADGCGETKEKAFLDAHLKLLSGHAAI